MCPFGVRDLSAQGRKMHHLLLNWINKDDANVGPIAARPLRKPSHRSLPRYSSAAGARYSTAASTIYSERLVRTEKARDPPAGWTLPSWRKGEASCRSSAVDTPRGPECEPRAQGHGAAMHRRLS